MSVRDAARAEAEKLMAEQRERVGITVREQQRYVEGFVAGAQWDREMTREITDREIEAAARALSSYRYSPERYVGWSDYYAGAARAALGIGADDE